MQNVFLAEEYKENFDSILPSLPTAQRTLLCQYLSRINPTAAPDGKDAVVVLVAAGHLVDDPSSPQDWDALVDRIERPSSRISNLEMGRQGCVKAFFANRSRPLRAGRRNSMSIVGPCLVFLIPSSTFSASGRRSSIPIFGAFTYDGLRSGLGAEL